MTAIEHKSASAVGHVGGAVADKDDPNVFTIIGAVTGVKDEVDDIILPGAFRETLRERTPKIIKDHEWSERLGKTLSIEELMPGDPRLPKTTPRGAPWPRAAGALVAKVRLFKSRLGQEAAERWREEGEDTQYSIGYAVKPGKSTRRKDGVRLIKAMNLFEISDVLWGAMPLCGPMPSALATKMLTGMAADTKNEAVDDEADEVALHEAALDEIDWAEIEAAAEADTPATKALAAALAAKAGGADRNRGGAENLRHWYLHGAGAAAIAWGTPGDFTRCVKIAGKHMTTERAKGYCNLRHKEATGMYPGDRNNKALPATDVVETGVMVAVYPPADVAEQIAVPGGLDPADLHVTLAFLGNVTDTPGGDGGSTLAEKAADIISAVRSVAKDRGTLTGQVAGLGHFPDMGDGPVTWAPVDVPGLSRLRERIVDGLNDVGAPARTDHGFTPHMTLGYGLADTPKPVGPIEVEFDTVYVVIGDQRTPIQLTSPASDSVGYAVDGGMLVKAYDPNVETGPYAGNRARAEVKSFPTLAGTYQERLDAIHAAVREVLVPPRDAAPDAPSGFHVAINGTYTDRVIATLHDWSETAEVSRSYEIGYVITNDGVVMLDEPTEVTLQATVVYDDDTVPDDDDVDGVPLGDLTPILELADAMVAGTKSLLATPGVKAGRVLSSANSARLAAAVENLLAVLAAAGVTVENPNETPKPDPASGDTYDRERETTSPSAREEKDASALVRMSAADIAADLAALTDA